MFEVWAHTKCFPMTFIGFLSIVDSLMYNQVCPHTEAFPTVVTSTGLLTSVESFMHSEGGTHTEGFLVVIIFIGLLSSVDSPMFNKAWAPGKLLSTFTTCITVFLPWACPHAFLPGSYAGKIFHTHIWYTDIIYPYYICWQSKCPSLQKSYLQNQHLLRTLSLDSGYPGLEGWRPGGSRERSTSVEATCGAPRGPL